MKFANGGLIFSLCKLLGMIITSLIVHVDIVKFYSSNQNVSKHVVACHNGIVFVFQLMACSYALDTAEKLFTTFFLPIGIHSCQFFLCPVRFFFYHSLILRFFLIKIFFVSPYLPAVSDSPIILVADFS